LANPKNPKIEVQGFSTKFPGIMNVIPTKVGISEAFDPQTTDPAPFPKIFDAIWDTGATNSAITEKVVSACGLKPVGMVRVHTASGEYETNVYLINMALPNKVGIANVRVTEGVLADVDVLIGMDVISRGDFCITNSDGHTAVSFQMPSVGIIDFDQHHQRVPQNVPTQRPAQRVGRNQPCPCGSGKKYKKCCGKSL
jgi:predicted aspartyl protease